MSKTHERESVIDFGPSRLQMVPFIAINELPQVRTTYDPAAIEELAQAIWTDRGDGTISSSDFELANPLLSGRHTKKSAKQFIDNHGEYFHIPTADRIDYQDLTPYDHDTAIILIAGHRRRRAIAHLINHHNLSQDFVRVAGNVRDEIEFDQAVSLQLRENVYDRPSPQDEARAIDLSYRYVQRRTGRVPSLKSLAVELGFKETKVRDAIAFASLPDSIQEYTNSGVLSYSVTRQLKPLFDVFVQYYQSLEASSQEAPAKAEFSVREFCDIHLQKRMQGRSDEKLAMAIKSQVKSIEDSIKYQQGSWEFEGLEASPELRARRANRELVRTAISVMRYRLNTGEMSDEEIADLEKLIASHRSAATQETIQPLFTISQAS
ncbi:MAG: hypothetical protein WAR37_04140 [Candidatus Microsaccharimonas sp.]